MNFDEDLFDFALDKAHMVIRYPRKKQSQDFRFCWNLVDSQELIFALRLTTLEVERITYIELSQIQAHKITSLKFLTAKVSQLPENDGWEPCIIEFPNLELMDLELKDEKSCTSTVHLLFQNCISLLKLKVNFFHDRLHLKVQNAEKLEIFELLTMQPYMIDFDSTSSLKYVTIDLANIYCFLELDRIHKKVFKFSNRAPNLKSFIFRTGGDYFEDENRFDENRYQAIKLLVNETLEMHSTHEVDLVEIKVYLQKLFPFIAQHMQGT